MAGITQAQAEARLTEYLTAESSVLEGQEITINGKKYTRANLREIRDGITYWNSQVQKLSRGGIRVRGGTPI